MAKEKKQQYQVPKGMHDILPDQQPYWAFVFKKAKTILEDYSFEKIDTPIVESTPLFVKTVGEVTDIVEKEMYSFRTKSGEQLALRPEFTAGIVRAYIEHGMQVLPHPVQLWSWGPVYRHDNPQAGRYRQFHQLNVEMIGDDSAAGDAQMIFLAVKILESFGLKNLTVKINSVGDASCRPHYLKALKDYYRGRDKKLCAKCQIRLKTNILRVLDCKEPECRETGKGVPQFVDYLDEDCKKHFKEVLEFLDEIGIAYFMDFCLVRGLDYYTRTAFEVWPEEKEGVTQGALCGGGRYDKLISYLGGPPTPSTGWAMGVERAIIAIKEAGIQPPSILPPPKIFIAQLGEIAKRKSLLLFEEFRKTGVTAKATFGRDSIKSQLKAANRLGIKYTLLMGQKEAIDNTIILREMDSGVQETVPLEKIVELVKLKLRK